MRYITTAVLSCVLLAACGGGGGAVPADSGGNNPPGGGSTAADAAIQALQACGPENLDELLLLVDLFQNLLNPVGTIPSFNLIAVDNVTKDIGWELDLDNDQQPDFLGSFRFVDPNDDPANVDLSGIQTNGLSALAGVFSQMPDMNRFVMEFNRLGAPITVGGFELLFESGLPTTVNGSVTVQSPTCESIFTLENAALTGLLNTTGIPTAVFQVLVSSSAVLEGTVTFDGSNTVRFDVLVDSTDNVSIEYDLQTMTYTDVTGP